MFALSPIARQEYYVELGDSLPPPVLDQPEYRQRRLAIAVEAFEALRPGDAYEARLAVQIVLSGAHAADSLREAGIYREDFAKKTRCRAQANSLMREERAAKRVLAQEQKLRLVTESVAGTLPAHSATAPAVPPQPAPQAEALPVQAVQAAPPPPVAVPPSAAPQRPAATRAAPQAAAAGTAPPPSPEAIARAEVFVEENLVAAAQIRHDRGVTSKGKAYFHEVTLPSDPAVIDALVRGSSELLILLDGMSGEALGAAA